MKTEMERGGGEERRGQVVAGVCERERVEMNEGTKK